MFLSYRTECSQYNIVHTLPVISYKNCMKFVIFHTKKSDHNEKKVSIKELSL